MTRKKRARIVPTEDIIEWVWENDDPAAPPCGSQHLNTSDQSVDPAGLRVYDSLLRCKLATVDKDAEGESAKLDTTLSNILVFGDDCRAATEWLRNESVSHDDEQGRRAGERRRHLKERGLLENGKRFVRICGQVVIDAGLVKVMAARQCIDWWQETWGESTLHFHKCENGVRWQPHGDSAEHKTLYRKSHRVREQSKFCLTQCRHQLMLDTGIGSLPHGTNRHQALKPVKTDANCPQLPEHEVLESTIPKQIAVR